MNNITEKLQNLWNSDEIRVIVLTSLGIQISLIFLAPLRKRSTKAVLALALWLLYLIADEVATLALGYISRRTPTESGVSNELTVLWAPFLLVHLGGPDTITSYSIEDNELWWRHLLGLVYQVIITVYVFFKSPPTGWLWIPTIFVFIPGLIKFAERTHALHLASKDNIKDKIISERPRNRTTKGSKDNTNANTVPANQSTEGSKDTTSNPIPENRNTEGTEDNTTSNPVPANRTTEGRWGNLKNKIMSVLCLAKNTTGNKHHTTSNLVAANQTTEGSEDNTTSNPVPANRTTEGSEDNTTSNPVPANRTTEGRWGNLKNKIMSVLCLAKDTTGSYHNTTSNPVPGNPTTEDDSIPESKAIEEGFRWFNIFKRLLVDVTFPADMLMESQDYFAEINSTEALKLVAIELSFLYDILHTKAVHMHTILGGVLRCFSLVSIIAALVVFHHLDMQKYPSKDIIVTYILFGTGLSLEVIATMLLVFSDWMVVTLTKTRHSKCVASCITAMVNVITSRKGKPRWAHTIGQYNLVGVCLRDRDTVLAKIMRFLKIKNKWDNMRECKLIPIPNKLEEIMFIEAKIRAQNVHIYNVLVEARSYRGSKTFERYGVKDLEWSMKREFDECIILWHLATDICYYNETSNEPKGNNDTEREVSWKTSNYMVYLLTQQQSMMQLGYGKTRFEATCNVIKKKFKGKEKLEHKIACEELINHGQNNGGRQSTDQMGTSGLKKKWACLRCWDRHKNTEDEDEIGESLLTICCRLAKELRDLKPAIKWKLISETWMEMFGYAAIHCDSYQHAKSLSRGGELITHLWLLMAQLGVVDEHKVQQFESGSVQF